MIVKEISPEIYNEFLLNYKHKHFLQSASMGLRRQLDGWKMFLLGFYQEENLVGAVQMTGRKIFFNLYTYEAIAGPLFNFDDFLLLEKSLAAFREYLDSIKAFECVINPNKEIKMHHPKEQDLADVKKLKKIFKKTGWQFIDNTDPNPQTFRWFFKKSLAGFENYSQVFETFASENKRIINKAKQVPTQLEELNSENLDRAIDLLATTAQRRNFEERSCKYHQSLFEYMNRNHTAKYMVISLKIDEYLQILQTEVNNLEADIKKDKAKNTKKAQNRIIQNTDQLQPRLSKIKQLKNVNKDTVDLCAGVFIGLGDTLMYLFGGSDENYMAYDGVYLLQDYMIKYAFENGYKIYDFAVTNSKLSGHPDQEGVYNFKKGFTGVLYENIGYFTYQPKNLINKTINILKKIKHAVS